MHKLAIPFLIAVGTVGLISPGHAQELSTQESIRVGTFDSRAVAIVYYQSEGQRQYRRGLRERYEAAEEAGVPSDTCSTDPASRLRPSRNTASYRRQRTQESLCRAADSKISLEPDSSM